MADFNKPATTDTYANFLAYLNAKIADLALGLDPANTTATNVPTNAVRWNSANNRFEKYNGTVWAILSTSFAFQDLSASGNVTLSGGAANGVPYLNASKQLTTGAVLVFDGTNLGLGTATPNNYAGYKTLTINGTATTGGGEIDFQDGGTTRGSIFSTSTGFFVSSYSSIALQFGINGAEKMRLDSAGNLGIGTSSPSNPLTVFGANGSTTNGAQFKIANTTGTAGATRLSLAVDDANHKVWFINGGSSVNPSFNWATNDSNTALMTLDAVGNLGLGLTPSAWGGGYKAQQFGTTGSVRFASGNLAFGDNYYFNGSSNLYLTTAAASNYVQSSGAHYWYNAPSGTAGTAITFTQAMTLDASGKLYLGLTTGFSKFTIQSESTYGAGLGLVNDATLNYSRLDFQATNTGGYTRIIGDGRSTGYIAFQTNDTERARIFASGGMSIGNTTDPGATNLSVSGTINDGTATLRPLVSGTSQATTSGTTKDFTAIPSWVKRITINFGGVSLSGTSNLLVQLGTGSTTFTTSGYASQVVTGLASVAASNSTAGFVVSSNFVASDTASGVITISTIGSNTWVEGGTLARNGSNGASFSAGAVSLGAALTAVRITTVNGTDTFDAGSINILYE